MKHVLVAINQVTSDVYILTLILGYILSQIAIQCFYIIYPIWAEAKHFIQANYRGYVVWKAFEINLQHFFQLQFYLG